MRKLCALFMLVILVGCNEPKIQEYELDMLISAMRSAVEEKDATLLRAQFTDDAVIEIAFPAQLGGNKRYSLDGYIKDVAAGWRMGIDQTYRVEDLQMQIADDGQTAVITDVVYEDAIHKGQVVMSSKSAERIEVKRVDKALKITKIFGDVELL
ncbi:hypothetical protein [Ketobacter sp.]|uniref:hypothetical protein n=1 Tax=Ketobacter sp. TaxID=2083498 RepID=UPI0025B9D9B6|nr:hypothetical protein [Ketobacter sp.]